MSKVSVVSSAQQWGITFPIALNGNQTAAAYGILSRAVFLIDRKGTVRAIATVPLASDTALVDSTVKSFAGKIPALFASAVRLRRMTVYCAGNGSAVGDNLKWTTDLKGRRLDGGGVLRAPQMAIDGARSARILVLRK
jgi:hypothetical protein